MAVHPEHLGREYGYNSKELNLSMFRDEFTPEERRILEEHGARIYTLTGRSLREQVEEFLRQRGMLLVFSYIPKDPDDSDSLDKTPSWKGKVAIFPDPNSFFVPGSFKKSLAEQEIIVAQDAESLRRELGLENITEIIPNKVSTVTELVLQHYAATGKWLFDKEYAHHLSLRMVYTRTKNEISPDDPLYAIVGDALPKYGGVDVHFSYGSWPCRYVGVMRLVVPIECQNLGN